MCIVHMSQGTLYCTFHNAVEFLILSVVMKNLVCLSCCKKDMHLCPGMDSMPSAVFSGGVMPSAEPGLNNLVSQPTVVTPTAAVSQPLVDPAGGGSINPSMQLAGGLPPGMQLIMQGQQAAAMQGQSNWYTPL